jgi:hypothetical protein
MVAAWVAPLLALVATIVSGITTFGDGVVFLILWSVWAKVTGEALDLTQGVLFVSLLPLTSLPVLLWAARKELRPALPWALVLSGTSMAMIWCGQTLAGPGVTGVIMPVIAPAPSLSHHHHLALHRCTRPSNLRL